MKRLLAFITILAPLPASALTITVPVGYSNYFFMTSQSQIVVNAYVYLQRDPTVCDACSTGYNDRFTVSFFDDDNSILQSDTYSNYFFYSMFNDSHGIGAGPIWINVPPTSVMFEVENFLALTGALNSSGYLTFLNSDTTLIPAPVPIPPALPLFATAMIAMLWRRR